MTNDSTDPAPIDVPALESKHVLQVYRRAPIVLVRGSGVRVYDDQDRMFLDLISGVGVASLGHANPGLAEAIADQARTLVHCSNLYYHGLQGRLAERLAALSGLSRAFFCNSGAEAVEACLKFARRVWHTRGAVGRHRFVALRHSFHGRTFGALSATWEPHYREPFEPLVPSVTFVSPDDPDALGTAVDDTTAAVILEPLQGEGGVRPLTREFAGAVQAACDRTGTLLIVDEVQSGLGRTGVPFYFSTLGLRPDLLALGKALGAGVPVGAAMMSEDVAETIRPGDHGSTYGGNLLACRAALFFLEQLVDHDVLAHVRRVGAHLERGLRDLATRHPALVIELRGAGLMWGIVLSRDAARVIEAALQRGLLVNRTGGTVVRMLPPLVISEAEIDEALAILDSVFGELGSEATA